MVSPKADAQTGTAGGNGQVMVTWHVEEPMPEPEPVPEDQDS
ncbi:hypothetical protein [Streptomyces sp. KL116D]